MLASRCATLAVLIAFPALVGCTSTRDALVARGFSPAYAQGYEHGCASGKASGGDLFNTAQKDTAAYANDRQYAQGWDAGYAKCLRDLQAMVADARTRPSSHDKND